MQRPSVECADSVEDRPISRRRRHHRQALSLVLGPEEGGLNGSLSLPPFSLSSSTSAAVDSGGSEGRGSLASSVSSGSLTGGSLLSPAEGVANISGCSSSSLLFSSLITPRRKLSMDLDESTQDASDSGYSRGESVSVSSVESCLNFSSALEAVISKPQTSSSSSSVTVTTSTRTPLSDLTNAACGRARRHRFPQKAKRSISFPSEEKGNKVSVSHFENHSPSCSHSPILPLSPLPCSPLSLESASSRKYSLQLINSPLERMTLMSPGISSASSSAGQLGSEPRPFIFPPRQLSHEPSVESDGYSEEVFDREDSASLSSDANSLPGRLTALMNAPFTSDGPSLKNDAQLPLCKLPVHSSTPSVQHGLETAAVPGRLSLVKADSWSAHNTRRGSLKRPSPCPDASDQPRKKKPPLPVFDSKSQDGGHPTAHCSPPLKGPQLLRSQSCSLGVPGDHVGLYPLSPGSDNGNFIGDHSKTYALPLCKSASLPDLKCISPETLAELVKGTGESACLVDEYLILDCRYPYEYKGGHIQGAQNIWSKHALQEQFFSAPEYTPNSRRSVIIFHCEFSTKRGPEMSRFMREIDRKRNGMAFPKLYYPELYLLEGGYKAFYELVPGLCEPKCYVTMLDENHKDELRHFKQRSKSWNGGDTGLCKRRGSKLRPRRSTIDSHGHPETASLSTSSIKS